MEIHQPHDKFFKAAFSHQNVVHDFLCVFLNTKTLADLDLDSLTSVNTSHINNEMSELRSDVIYRIKFRKNKGYLYLPFEHQSTIDSEILWKFMEYSTEIAKRAILRQIAAGSGRKNCKFPIIIPLIVFNGLENFEWPPKFEGTKRYIKFALEFFKNSFLMKLQDWSIKKLLKLGKAALLFILLREKLKRYFKKFLRTSKVLGKLINNSPYWRNALMYILSGLKGDQKKILKTIKGLNKNIIDNVMEVLEKREQKGIRKGIRRGIRQGITRGITIGEKRGEKRGITIGEQDIIKRLLVSGMPREQVAERLNMTLIELNTILFFER